MSASTIILVGLAALQGGILSISLSIKSNNAASVYLGICFGFCVGMAFSAVVDDIAHHVNSPARTERAA